MDTLTVTQQVAAARDRVWLAWTDPAELDRWFWPPRLGARITVDATPDGIYRISSESAGMAVSGRFETVDPPARLVMTWQWDGDEEVSLVDVSFTEQDGGTLVRVDHEGLTSQQAYDAHRTGWTDCLGRLDYLEG